MSALDGLTVCITAHHRPERLVRCIASAKEAGVKNIVTACGEEWGEDIGCNNTWMVAAYRASTKRILVLHDDDTLDPSFGKAYKEVIAPAMDRGEAGFVSWNASHKLDDGTIEPCPYWEGPSTLMPSHHLLRVVGQMGRLSLSPIVSIFNRAVLIRACKEANDTLTGSQSILRPGMTLGTEILVYLRHIQAFKRWLYLDKVLSYYGKHAGSGTVQAQKANDEKTLIAGYDLARVQGSQFTPAPRPRLLMVYSAHAPKDEDTIARNKAARFSWDFHFSTAEMVEVPFEQDGLPKIRDILDHACALALPEDIVVYANLDAGLTTTAVEKLTEGLARGNGVTFCGNRSLYPQPRRLYKSILQCKPMGGIDIIAMTPAWWKLHRDRMPDMFIGREAWDNCFQALAMEWADGYASADIMFAPGRWRESKAFTDDVCWHTEHAPRWQQERESDTSRHNREMAMAFFASRGNTKAMAHLK